MTLELATQRQSVQRSPPPPSMYKKNLHCSRHFFKENSQEKRAVPFPSLSISLKRLPKTTPYTLGLSVMREADILFPGWMLVSCRISQPAPQGVCEVEALEPRGCSLQKHNKATDPQQKWKWAILEFIGVNMWVFLWIKRIPWNIVVWVILRSFYSNGLPGQGLRDTPVIYHWRTGTEGHEWITQELHCTHPIMAWCQWASWRIHQGVYENSWPWKQTHQLIITALVPFLSPCQFWRSQKHWVEGEAERRVKLEMTFLLIDDHH